MLSWLMIANGVAFCLMLIDKLLALKGMRRIPEKWLLGWALAGGAAGSLAASRLARHKTRKRPFRTQLMTIFCLELGLLLAWAAGLLPPAIAAGFDYWNLARENLEPLLAAALAFWPAAS